MSNDPHPAAPRGDNPIRNPEDDVLGRLDTATSFARHVLKLDVSQGAVVGVLGPWGAGKTSFVNLARTEFNRAGIPALDFNPWLFSGTEQLVVRFFAELSAELKLRDLTNVSEALADYGNAVSGKMGIWLKITSTFLRRHQGGIANYRKRVEQALEKRKKPLIVVLDDIDRLSTAEIRDVFKLVRLTASFPNLIYIVACDRLRVEQALQEQGISGQDYLEKILQLPFDLPEVPRQMLERQLFTAIDQALADIENPGPFDPEAWSDVYRQIIRPLIRNMRDVRRYVATIRGTAVGLDGRIARPDMLGLEAVRIFLPEVFRQLPGATDSLTATSGSQSFERDFESRPYEPIDNSTDPDAPLRERRGEKTNELIKAADKRPEVVRAMIGLLFPEDAGERKEELLKDRRVTHEHVLRFYLERVVNDDLLSFYDAERALTHMADRKPLDGFIRSLEPSRWQDVVSNLNGLEFSPEHVVPGIIVLLNLLPDMPERSQDPFDSFNPPERTVREVVRSLLQQQENDVASIESVVRGVLPEVTALSSKLELVSLVGHQPESGAGLVSKMAATEFEKTLRDEIQSAPVNDLVVERNLLFLLRFAKNGNNRSEETFTIDASPKLTFALLKSVATNVVMQHVTYPRRRTFTETVTTTGLSDGFHIDKSTRLNWDALVGLYGDKITLKATIGSLNSQFENLKPWITSQQIPLDEAVCLLELANQHLDR